MLRFFWTPYFALILLAIIALISPLDSSLAKPLSQQIFEDQIGMKCVDASDREIEFLSTCGQTPQSANLGDLDSTAEYLLFKPIALNEVKQLNCLQTQIERINNSPQLQSSAVKSTCEKIEILKHTLNAQDLLQKRIQTYKSVNDRSLRNIPQDQYEKNELVLSELKTQLHVFKAIENSLRASDTLLGLPNVYEKLSYRLRDGTLLSGDSPQKACTYLKKNIDEFLKSAASNVKENRDRINKRINEGNDWLEDEDFKRSLWSSGSKNKILRDYSKAETFKNSTFCRMEGRYGHGAEVRDKIFNAATLALGGGAPALGRLAVLAAFSKRAEVLVMATRTALGIDVTVGSTLGVMQTMHACKDKIDAISEDKSCQPTTEETFHTLFYKKQDAESCLLTASLTVVSGGLSARGVKTALLDYDNAIGKELAFNIDFLKKLVSKASSERKLEINEKVLVMRSSKEYSYGEVASIEGDVVKVRVKMVDAQGKLVDGLRTTSISQVKSIGSHVLVPRNPQGYMEGEIVGYLDTGKVLVTFKGPDGKAAFKKLDPADLKPTDIPNRYDEGMVYYDFKSRKIDDYTARGGEKVIIDFSSPRLKSAIGETMDNFERASVKAVDPTIKPSVQDMQKAAESWLKSSEKFAVKIKAIHEESEREFLNRVSQARDEIMAKGGGQATLGGLVLAEAAVCRELSIMGSVALSELGYTTRIVSGRIAPAASGIKRGSHAWIEILDPKTGDVVGLIDNNYTRKFYANPKDYYREMNATPVKYTIVAAPF